MEIQSIDLAKEIRILKNAVYDLQTSFSITNKRIDKLWAAVSELKSEDR